MKLIPLSFLLGFMEDMSEGNYDRALDRLPKPVRRKIERRLKQLMAEEPVLSKWKDEPAREDDPAKR